MKTQKGITLVALIITIVVLLILSAVAISDAIDDGIIDQAENSADRYNAMVEDDREQLDEYYAYLNEELGCEHIWSGWTINKVASCVNETDGEKTRTCIYCGETDSLTIEWENSHSNLVTDTGRGQSKEGCIEYELCIDCWTYTGNEWIAPHSWWEGSCGTCGYQCDHEWSNGVCLVCSYTCTHPNGYDGGTCQYCGFSCPHNNKADDPARTSLGEKEHEVYVVCTDCWSTVDSYTEGHLWYEGNCSGCGYSCQHDYSAGVCTKCDYACQHYNKTEDPGKSPLGEENHECIIVCTDCWTTVEAYPEPHSWYEGACTICWYECKHDWSNNNGICVDCETICKDCKDAVNNADFPVWCSTCGRGY